MVLGGLSSQVLSARTNNMGLGKGWWVTLVGGEAGNSGNMLPIRRPGTINVVSNSLVCSSDWTG